MEGRRVSEAHLPARLLGEACLSKAHLDFELTDPVTSSKSDGALGRAVAPALDSTAALLIPRSLPCGLFHGAKSIRNNATIPIIATIAATKTGTATPGAFFPCACNWLSLCFLTCWYVLLPELVTRVLTKEGETSHDSARIAVVPFNKILMVITNGARVPIGSSGEWPCME
jgi:hypothetical protein